MLDNPLFINVVYLVAMIVLPLVPAWVLYKMLPERKGDNADVKGRLFGLNIKFSGAFAGYLVLVLFAWNFISNIQGKGPAVETGSQFEYFTVNGRVDVSTFNNYVSTHKSQDVLLSPPESVFYSDGTFTIKNVPIDIETKKSRLIITDGSGPNRKESIIYIQDGEVPEFLGAKAHKVEFAANNQINITTPIQLTSLSDQGGF